MSVFCIFVLFYVLWILYIAVMALKRVGETTGLTWPMKIFGLPLFVVGLGLDWFLNMTLFTVLFLELPLTCGELITGRLKRWRHADGFRQKLSSWLAEMLLDSFDPSGRHV